MTVQVQAILSQWLPLSDAVLSMVCLRLPSPRSMTAGRAEKLMSSPARPFDALPAETQRLRHSFVRCAAAPDDVDDDVPLIVFISKMTPVRKKKGLPSKDETRSTRFFIVIITEE